jgi:hypothetical protein
MGLMVWDRETVYPTLSAEGREQGFPQAVNSLLSDVHLGSVTEVRQARQSASMATGH